MAATAVPRNNMNCKGRRRSHRYFGCCRFDFSAMRCDDGNRRCPLRHAGILKINRITFRSWRLSSSKLLYQSRAIGWCPDKTFVSVMPDICVECTRGPISSCIQKLNALMPTWNRETGFSARSGPYARRGRNAGAADQLSRVNKPLSEKAFAGANPLVTQKNLSPIILKTLLLMSTPTNFQIRMNSNSKDALLRALQHQRTGRAVLSWK